MWYMSVIIHGLRKTMTCTVQRLQVATSNRRNVISISLDNGHNFISYRVQAIRSKSIGHTCYTGVFAASSRNAMYISSCKTHEMRVNTHQTYCTFLNDEKTPNWKPKYFLPFKTKLSSLQTHSPPLLRRILRLFQCQHSSLAVEYCSLQLWVLPADSLLMLLSTETARGGKTQQRSSPVPPEATTQLFLQSILLSLVLLKSFHNGAIFSLALALIVGN